MKKCVIIGAGDFTCPKIIREGDLIIAADGGYDHAVNAKIAPHLFIGDMDSLTSALPENLEKKTFPERKDYTDMQLSYMEGKERGYTNFEIYGGTGGRSDHTFANIALLLKMADDGCSCKMISEKEIYTVIKNGSLTVNGEAGNYISVFAYVCASFEPLACKKIVNCAIFVVKILLTTFCPYDRMNLHNNIKKENP